MGIVIMTENKNSNDKKNIVLKKMSNKHSKGNDYIVLSKRIEDSLSAFKHIKSMNSLKFVDPLRELRMSMRALQLADPLKGLRESMRALQLADPLKDLRDSIKFLQISDPLRGLRESMKALQYADPLRELRVSINTLKMIDPLKGLRESIKAVQFADPFKDIRASVKSFQMADPLKELRESINLLRHSFQFNEIRTQLLNLNRSIDVYRNVFKDSIPATNFEQAYQEIISKVIIAKNDIDIDEALSVVADEIDQDSRIVPNSFLSIEFYINLIISFIFLLYSMHLSAESENRLAEQMMNAQTVIIEKLEEVLTTQNTHTYYVVLRPVNLRLRPTTKKSNVINILCSNQTVRLIERKGKWIKVEYFNHISGVHEHGWCYKKYLKIMKKP